MGARNVGIVIREAYCGKVSLVRAGAIAELPQCPSKRAMGVGIAIQARSPLMRQAVPAIRRAMEGAVLEAEASGRLGDSDFVKTRMAEARGKTLKTLFGTIGGPKL